MTRKKKHRNSEIEQVIVYMKQLAVVFFFFPGDRTAGDVYDGSIQAHMGGLYRKKV